MLLVTKITSLIIPTLTSYLIGSVSSGMIIAKIFKLGDLKKQGSGSTGGTNVARAGGKALGILTITLDMIKGMIVMSLIQKLNLSPVEIAIMGLITVLGHIFPIWLKFSGGKGVATTLGVLIVIDPYTAIVFASTWLITFASIGISSLSSLLAVGLSFIWACFALSGTVFLVYCAIFGLILWRHKTNIKRLYHKEEKRLH